MDKVLEHLNSPTFILLDNIDKGIAAPSLDQSFWDGLRALGNDIEGGKLGFLATSRELPSDVAQTHQKPSPFFNIFGHVLNLGPLLEAEAHDLLQAAQRSAQLPGAPDPNDWKWILEKSQCWPSYLQRLADCYIKAIKYGEPAQDNWREACLERIKPLVL